MVLLVIIIINLLIINFIGIEKLFDILSIIRIFKNFLEH